MPDSDGHDSFNIVANDAPELSRCDFSAEVGMLELRRRRGNERQRSQRSRRTDSAWAASPKGLWTVISPRSGKSKPRNDLTAATQGLIARLSIPANLRLRFFHHLPEFDHFGVPAAQRLIQLLGQVFRLALLYTGTSIHDPIWSMSVRLSDQQFVDLLS
jgi:hypothetical protein